MRAFLAVTPPEPVRRAVSQRIAELSALGANVTWVPEGQLHLTLKFLDEITDDQRLRVLAMLDRVTQAHAPILLQLGPLGAFPSLREPRVLWAGMAAGGEPLTALAAAIERESDALSVRRELRPYAPHLTIGRVRGTRGIERLRARLESAAWPAPLSWTAGSVRLYESVLGAQGARHTVIGECALRGRA